LRCLNPTKEPIQNIDPLMVQKLIKMLDEHNPFAKKFRTARDILSDYEDGDFIIRIVGAREGDPVQYNLPTTDELAMLVCGDLSLDTFKRDIIIPKHNRDLKRISSLHPVCMALQYPLLFPFGERGFQIGVPYVGMGNAQRSARSHMAMHDFFSYRFHYKKNEPNHFLCYRPLSSQAKVDARAAIDENRLQYILQNQNNLRTQSIEGISDVVGRGCIDGEEMDLRVVLPASHIGGRRYMFQNYHDGLAICRVYGPPDFFVTFTCNPNWPEILESMFEPGQKTSDRPNIIVRVFHLKHNVLLNDIRFGDIFGRQLAGTITPLQPLQTTIRIFKTNS
jgi:hypothetical protein